MRQVVGIAPGRLSAGPRLGSWRGRGAGHCCYLRRTTLVRAQPECDDLVLWDDRPACESSAVVEQNNACLLPTNVHPRIFVRHDSRTLSAHTTSHWHHWHHWHYCLFSGHTPSSARHLHLLNTLLGLKSPVTVEHSINLSFCFYFSLFFGEILLPAP